MIVVKEGVTTLSIGGHEWTKPTNALFNTLDKYQDDIIPHQLRWQSLSGKVLVLEFPPQYIMIEHRETDHNIFRIPTPWTIYIVNLNDNLLSLFARPSQLTSIKDKVYHYYLSNVHVDGIACGGFQPATNKKDSWFTQALKLITAFWKSNFNGGMYYLPKKEVYLPKELWPYAKSRSGIFIFADKYYGHIETLSLQDMVGLSWQSAGTLDSHLKSYSEEAYDILSHIIRVDN